MHLKISHMPGRDNILQIASLNLKRFKPTHYRVSSRGQRNSCCVLKVLPVFTAKVLPRQDKVYLYKYCVLFQNNHSIYFNIPDCWPIIKCQHFKKILKTLEFQFQIKKQNWLQIFSKMQAASHT